MVDEQLQVTGGVTRALFVAFDEIAAAIARQLTEPDGSPSGTLAYLHQPVGRPIDPRMFAHPWTPMGGASSSQVTSTGGFATSTPVAAPAATAPATPAAALAAAPPAPDEHFLQAMKAAYFTCRLVDGMLMVTDKGVAKTWSQHNVGIEYFTVLQGMQAMPVPPPPDEVRAAVDAATRTLYVVAENGDLTGYTARYQNYQRNVKAWRDATAKLATEYAMASLDPSRGLTFPIVAGQLQAQIDQAYADIYGMGGKDIENARATLRAQGGSAVAALIEKAHKLYDAYSVNLAGAVGDLVPWSYIDPESWWDPTNNDFGVMQVRATSEQYAASGSSSSDSASHSFYRNQASSTGGGFGLQVGFFSIGANASHSESSSDWGSDDWRASRSQYQDESSSATVEFEWFLASIERPWLLGDLFHMDGWYLSGKKKGSISDGTLAELQDDSRILPLIPKGFVVVRNVTITADAWGSAGEAFANASSSSTGHTDAESTSWGGSAGYFGIGGSVQHSDSASSGAFGAQSHEDSGWSFERNGQGGTLRILGAQIVGWLAQIQPMSPKDDAPSGDGAAPAQPTPAQPTPAQPTPAQPTPATPPAG